MTQMLREMRQSMLSDDEDEKGLGKDTMTDSLDIELGGVLEPRRRIRAGQRAVEGDGAAR